MKYGYYFGLEDFSIRRRKLYQNYFFIFMILKRGLFLIWGRLSLFLIGEGFLGLLSGLEEVLGLEGDNQFYRKFDRRNYIKI